MTVPQQRSSPDPALALRGLVKRFDAKLAVAGIDLDVPAGSFFGLLGPNGAGKTTTIRMLAGLIGKTSGEARVADCRVGDPATARKLTLDLAALAVIGGALAVVDTVLALAARATFHREEILTRWA